MNKIIVIPGFKEGKQDRKSVKSTFKDFDIIYFDYNTNLHEPIEDISLRLKKFIESLHLKKNEKIDIIGLSAGGIIADYYIKFFPHKRVNKFISVFSPFHGSFWANLFSKGKGIRELIPKSKFLKKLSRKKEKGVRRMSLWCFFDPISGMSAKGVNPNHTWFFFHDVRFINPRFKMVSKVKEFLGQK